MEDTIQKFINDTTDFVLNHHEDDNFPDILISIGDYRLEVPNNADTFTKLVCYLHDIKQDVN